MKKLNVFFVSLILTAALVSCSKEGLDEGAELKSAATNTGVTPIVMTGNGGNASCEDIGLPFTFSSGKVDFVDGHFVFENGMTGWPEGLEVFVTDGKYVSFTYSSSNFCVGAVIVKGGNASNVYLFDGGTKNGSNLNAPAFYNGNGKLIIPGLSNLTFCFVECKPEIVIALKTFLKDTSTSLEYYAVSGGEGSEYHASYMGYNNYDYENIPNIYPLIRQGSGHTQIGTISAKDYIEDDVHYLELEIDTYDDVWLFLRSYLYVGSANGYNFLTELGPDNLYHTDWSAFPFTKIEESSVHIFKIPFSEILL
jgi:hypothetical protein